VRASKAKITGIVALSVAALLGMAGLCLAQATQDSASIKTADLDKEIRDFLSREMAAHVADIKGLDPPPDRVVGALTTGEFSWGTFTRTLAAYSDFAGTRTVAGRDVVPMVAQMGLIELHQGGKAGRSFTPRSRCSTLDRTSITMLCGRACLRSKRRSGSLFSILAASTR